MIIQTMATIYLIKYYTFLRSVLTSQFLNRDRRRTAHGALEYLFGVFPIASKQMIQKISCLIMKT